MLIAGSTIMLLIAGTIEGLISPIPYWPLQWKASVAALTAILLYAYLRGAPTRRVEVRADEKPAKEVLGL